MKPHTASLINAVILIIMSAWAYFSSATPSMTALIPAFFGIVLLICYPGIKSHNKIVAHIAVLLTVVLLAALFMPLKGALGRGDTLAVVRVAVMILSTVVAIIFFVKSFIDARRSREAEAGGE